MAENNTRQRRKAELSVEDHMDDDAEVPLGEDPAGAEEELPPDEYAVTTEPKDPAVSVQEEETSVTKAAAGEVPGEVPMAAKDWLTITYWGTLAPVGSVLLFGTSCACIFSEVADVIMHREGDPRFLSTSHLKGWFLDDICLTF